MAEDRSKLPPNLQVLSDLLNAAGPAPALEGLRQELAAISSSGTAAVEAPAISPAPAPKEMARALSLTTGITVQLNVGPASPIITVGGPDGPIELEKCNVAGCGRMRTTPS